MTKNPLILDESIFLSYPVETLATSIFFSDVLNMCTDPEKSMKAGLQEQASGVTQITVHDSKF